jgi:peptidoglycan glycosyltransferase
MNRQIVRLFGLIVVLFILLIVWTTRWTVIDASALNENPLNSRTLIAQLRVDRGRILADNDEVLARSVRESGGVYSRTYPTGSLFSLPVGYADIAYGESAGLERSRDRELRGIQTGLSSVFGPLGGTQQVGDDVYTTLDPKAQEVAQRDLDGRAGSVVALNPRTGAVLAMYSNPSYTYDGDRPAPCPSGVTACQINAAVYANYPPGSTFKIVTATAAIDSGRYTPNSFINGNSPVTISGVPLHNDSDKSWGPISLTTALTYSVNTVFAQIAEAVGRPTMTRYMRRFGFYAKPPLDLPSDEMLPSRPYSPDGDPYPPGSPDEDIGRIAIGQGGLGVTPMQMAMVASAVADSGTLMRPHLTSKVVNQDGQTEETIHPSVYRHVMRPSTAAEITQMMRNVVEEGTGQPAQLGSGIAFAGKTGTASVGPNGADETQPWFIGFAPAGDPKVAVAVTVNRTVGGYGGTIAAPIARDVVQTLLSEGK